MMNFRVLSSHTPQLLGLQNVKSRNRAAKLKNGNFSPGQGLEKQVFIFHGNHLFVTRLVKFTTRKQQRKEDKHHAPTTEIRPEGGGDDPAAGRSANWH